MAFILLRLLLLGVIAAAADDVHITWLTPPRGMVPCVVAEAGRAQRRPPPPLDADDRPRAKPYRRRGEEDVASKQMESVAEVIRKRNGTEGVYQCSVRRHGGTVLGYPAPWRFAYMDKQFSKHPENSTARAGQPSVLSCEVSSAPAPSVSWLKNGESLPYNDRIILVENQLLFTEVLKEDEGVYKCVATNSHLSKTRISNSAWLRVEGPEAAPPSLLEIHDEANVTAARLSRVRLLCPVRGWPKPKITWEFTAPVSRTAMLESTDEVLELTSLDLDQEGVYKCSVDGHSHISKTYNVTVTEPVSIILPPVSKEVVRVSTVRFNCTATGRPAPTITWYKDGKPLVLGGRFNLRSSISGNRYELVVGDVDSEDAGVYQCFAQSGNSVASSWAVLSVTGSRADAPGHVQCWPLGAKSVLVQWEQPNANVMAYTVQASKMQASEKQTTITAWPGQPHTNTEETVTVGEALTPYGFQVRAYIRGLDKNLASDKSDPVFCQGQGVPIRVSKLANDSVVVSWKEFAQETPGVVQWLLQYRAENSSEETQVPLGPNVVSYTLHASQKEPLQVRVLGSRSQEWLPQNLTYLPWTSTANQDVARAVMTAIPEDVRVSGVGARGFSVAWRCEAALPYAFLVCVRKNDGSKKCLDSFNNSVTVSGLEPDTEYEVEVQARPPARAAGGPFSAPVLVTTLSEASELLKEITWKYVNESTVRVSWNAPPDRYTVLFSGELKAPLEQWDSLDTMGNTVLISGIDPPRDIFVIVKGYGEDPQVYSPMMTIPANVIGTDVLKYSFTEEGVKVWWEGRGPRVVKYSQNLTLALDLWPSLTVPGSSIELRTLDPSLRTYVMVSPPGAAPRSTNVLTIEPRPPDNSDLLLGVGIGVAVGVCVLAGLTAAACVWRRRKRASSPQNYCSRSRRRHMSSNGDDEEEAAEMKSVGGRLANGGGSKDAGEPLLNGHVHITENPQSKAPNGKMKKGLMPFDVSRYEDADTTAETVLEGDSSTYDLLDTSRPPDEPSGHDSFAKLPDDNMNSELTHTISGFPSDNSKIQPTLQPNG